MDPIIYAAYLCSYITDEADALSISAQWDQLKAEADARGIQIGPVFSDTTCSSDTTDNRPGLQQALAAAKAGQLQALFISSHDRLSRSPNQRRAITLNYLLPSAITLIVAAAKG